MKDRRPMHDESASHELISRAHLVTQDKDGNFVAYPREDEIVISHGEYGQPERRVRVITGRLDKMATVFPETLDGVVGDHVTLTRNDLRETNKGLVVDFAIVGKGSKVPQSRNLFSSTFNL